MSVWTHVCGCVRIDSIDHKKTSEDIPRIFGKVLRYEDDVSVWNKQAEHPELFTPTGSEGGIEYCVYEEQDASCMASHVVCIWGDLRDYQNEEEIIKWFYKILYRFCIRNAVFNIDVEDGNMITVICDGYSDDVLQIKKLIHIE